MDNKEWKEKTKLEKVDKFRLVYNILMAIFSVIVSILEKDFTWIIVALLWGSIALEEVLNAKLMKQKDFLIDLLEDEIKTQDKIIKEYMSYQIRKIKDIKVPKYFSKPNEEKMLERWKYLKEHGNLKVPILIDENNNLKDGYTSYLIVKSLGLSEINVKVVD